MLIHKLRLLFALKLIFNGFRLMPDCQKKDDLAVLLKPWATQRDTLEAVKIDLHQDKEPEGRPN